MPDDDEYGLYIENAYGATTIDSQSDLANYYVIGSGTLNNYQSIPTGIFAVRPTIVDDGRIQTISIVDVDGTYIQNTLSSNGNSTTLTGARVGLRGNAVNYGNNNFTADNNCISYIQIKSFVHNETNPTGPWTANTAYAVGAVVFNDSDKNYVCITAGTSAGSGGPTGTGSSITDNTAVWRYTSEAGYGLEIYDSGAGANPGPGDVLLTTGGADAMFDILQAQGFGSGSSGRSQVVLPGGINHDKFYCILQGTFAYDRLLRVVFDEGPDLNNVFINRAEYEFDYVNNRIMICNYGEIWAAGSIPWQGTGTLINRTGYASSENNKAVIGYLRGTI